MPNSHLDHDHSAAGSSVVDVGRYDGLTFDATADLFKALSSPLRLAIVHAVHESPKCVHELVTELGVSQPLVSQHLRVLRAARVVHGERRGREIAYLLTDHHIGHIVSDALAHTEEPTDD